MYLMVTSPMIRLTLRFLQIVVLRERKAARCCINSTIIFILCSQAPVTRQASLAILQPCNSKSRFLSGSSGKLGGKLSVKTKTSSSSTSTSFKVEAKKGEWLPGLALPDYLTRRYLTRRSVKKTISIIITIATASSSTTTTTFHNLFSSTTSPSHHRVATASSSTNLIFRFVVVGWRPDARWRQIQQDSN